MNESNRISASRIRNKLFWKLGIRSDPSGACPSTYIRKCHEVESTSSEDDTIMTELHTSTRSSISHCEVNSVEGLPPLFSQSCLLNHHQKTINQKKGVVFNEKVQVITIPSRNDYSERVKQVLWASHKEMIENTQRNTYEFVVAEGRDWRHAVEEKEMYLCEFSDGCKDFVHPIHFQKNFEHNRYAGDILATRLF